MEENKMFSISHWGMFELDFGKISKTQAGDVRVGTLVERPSKVASQFVGGWPYGRYSKIEEIIEKVNGSNWDVKA